jgi:hypothetical protein
MPPKKGSKAGTAAAAAAKSGASAKGATKEPTGENIVLSLAFPSMDIMAIGLGRISAFLEDPVYEGRAVDFRTLVAANSPAIRYAGHNFPITHYHDACNALGNLTNAEKTVQVRRAKCPTCGRHRGFFSDACHSHRIKSAVCFCPTHPLFVTPFFSPFFPLQRAILQAARSVKPPATVYIVAHVSGDLKTLEHEKHHATFHFCPDYRARVQGIWAGVAAGNPSWAGQFHTHLGGLYCERVWLDEFQAIVLNREYECAAKTVALLQSAVPPVQTLPYRLVSVDLPTRGLEQEVADKAFGRDVATGDGETGDVHAEVDAEAGVGADAETTLVDAVKALALG